MHIADEIAKQRVNRHVSFEDRRQDAYLGLIDAARSFKPGEGAAFRTFAAYRIKGAILDAERARYCVVKIGRRGLARGETVRVVNISKVYAERELNGSRWIDMSDIVFVAPDDGAERLRDVRESIESAMGVLPARDRVLFARYWLDGLSLAKASAEHGLSESRGSQIVNEAMTKLRDHSALAEYAA
jgi:RNA polymerase sigma factor for flagellar operon FliA